MNKRDFLSALREALSYDLPEQLVDSNLRYYSSYIDDEVRKGRGHEEVLAELGDPKLIAKSIVDAIKSGADGVPGTADDVSFSDPAYEDSRSAFRRGQAGCDTFDEAGNAACEDAGGFTGSASGAGNGTPSGAGFGSAGYGNGGAGRGDFGSQNDAYGTGGHGGFGGGFHQMQFHSGCFGCLMAFLVVFAIMSLIGTLVGGVLTILSPILGPLLIVMLIVWLVHRLKG